MLAGNVSLRRSQFRSFGLGDWVLSLIVSFSKVKNSCVSVLLYVQDPTASTQVLVDTSNDRYAEKSKRFAIHGLSSRRSSRSIMLAHLLLWVNHLCSSLFRLKRCVECKKIVTDKCFDVREQSKSCVKNICASRGNHSEPQKEKPSKDLIHNSF